MGRILLGNAVVGWESETDFPTSIDGDDSISSIVISHNVRIDPPLQGQGYGQKAHVARLARWITEGRNYALCTVRRDNAPQLHILQKNGWVRLANTASQLGTPIYIMGRNLR